MDDDSIKLDETVESSPSEQHLEAHELLKMELMQSEKALILAKTTELKKDIVIKELQKQIYGLKNELLAKAVEEDKRKLADEQLKLNSKKEETQEFNKQLAEKYELDGAWGFNPETGLIIRED